MIPDLDPPARLSDMDSARKELPAAIDEVPVLDADRLLRTFMNLVEATLRTNLLPGQALPQLQAQPGGHLRCPVPPAQVRNLGLFAPG